MTTPFEQTQQFEQSGARQPVSTIGADLLTDPQAVRSTFNIRGNAVNADDTMIRQVAFGRGDGRGGEVKEVFFTQLDQNQIKENELRQNGLDALGAKDYKKAEQQFKDLLELRKTMYGEKSKEVAETINLLGFSCEADGRFGDAKKYYKQGVDVCAAVYGKDSFYTGMQIQNVAHMDGQLGNWKEAVPNYKEALRIYEKADPKKDKTVAAETVLTLNDYAAVLDRLGDKQGAAAQRQRMKEIMDFWKQKQAKPNLDV